MLCSVSTTCQFDTAANLKLYYRSRRMAFHLKKQKQRLQLQRHISYKQSNNKIFATSYFYSKRNTKSLHAKTTILRYLYAPFVTHNCYHCSMSCCLNPNSPNGPNFELFNITSLQRNISYKINIHTHTH